MTKETVILFRQGKKTSKIIVKQDIDYLVYAFQEYAEREGWIIK